MAEEQAEIGHNLTEVKAEIMKAFNEVRKLGDERTAINDEVQAIRDNLVTKGIPKEAFDTAVRYANWDEDKRRGFDTAYQICREAIGLPVQADLFDPPATAEGEQPAPAAVQQDAVPQGEQR